MSGRIEQLPSGLLVPRAWNFWEHRRTTRTVTLPSGERAKVTIDDSGTVMQITRAQPGSDNECLDAVVRPKTVRLRLRRAG